MLTDWINKYTTYLLPNHCDLCGLAIDKPYQHPLFCRSCLNNFALQPRCLCCGLIMPEQVVRCGSCVISSPSWSRLYCVGDYQAPLSGYVHRLKYLGQFWHAKTLALLLAPHIRVKPDLITFVPLHWRRFLYRGYNQSQHLAWELSKHMDVACYGLFRKVRTTARQQGMTKKQRVRNVKQAFELCQVIDIDHVAIVDDVLTTGSTVEPLCQLLHLHGVKTIDIYCVCRTSEPTDNLSGANLI
ncbi:ComF family protein [Vibrio pectenicida]|uniref:ComF family protein n=1 Tax=Vibrio pectenicida TaxID=62763 RepID=A0A7Y3ZWT4_9VIBR|nr:ComF family protein [Vibrio pectenicida]NOH70373.1 ComF family protein [Vibrio pectenicida]